MNQYIEQYIKQCLERHGIQYTDIESSESLKKIHNLYSDGKITSQPVSGLEAHYFGNYFKINNDQEKMKQYFRLGINFGFSPSMNAMGLYHFFEEQMGLAKKYFLMAIDLGDTMAMTNLGLLYKEIDDIDNMKKYYHMGIEKKDHGAAFNLAVYYFENGDVEQYKKYVQIAINYGSKIAMCSLGLYYMKTDDKENMLKYLEMASECGYSRATLILFEYYILAQDFENSYRCIHELIQKNDIYTSLLTKSLKNILNQTDNPRIAELVKGLEELNSPKEDFSLGKSEKKLYNIYLNTSADK